MIPIKVLLATQKPFAEAAVDAMNNVLNVKEIELIQLQGYKTKRELLSEVKAVDALIVRSDTIDKEVFCKAKQLKLVIRAGSGYDNIDIKAAHDAGVVVMNTPGQNANAVAELVFGLLLFGVRNGFSGVSGVELKGKTLGIHAFGNVGQNVARIAHGFDMKVLAYDPYTPSVKIFKWGVTPVSCAEELYSKSDIISLHLPYTALTKGLVNSQLLKNLPLKAVLVNTARNEVICEEDMLQMLQERTDFKYLTDITPSQLSKFQSYKNQFLTTSQKTGAQTYEANINAAVAAAHELVDFFTSGNVQFQVN